MDALRAILPAGTLSGAPKIRAMQIIDELEPVKRGAYGGAVGYLSYTGDLDTCIDIRTVVVKDGVAHVQAGGGIVADSEPATSTRETEAKAARGVAGGRARVRAGGVAMKVLVIDNYDSFTYNLVQYLGELGAERRGRAQRRSDGRRAARARRRPRRRLAGPVHAGRGRASRSRRSARFPEAGIPMLGVCLGHQAMAQAFGGKVVRGEPVHGKTAEIEHDGRTSSTGCRARSTVGRYHSLVVEQPTLPDELEVTRARRRRDQGVRHRELPAEGVQFHPESILTRAARLLRNFLAAASARRGGIA